MKRREADEKEEKERDDGVFDRSICFIALTT